MGLQKRRRARAKKEAGNVVQPKKANREGKHIPKQPRISKQIDKMWDSNKTLKQNYDAAGLAFDPNAVVSSTQQKLVEKGIILDPEEADIDEVIQSQVPVARGVKKLESKLDVPEAAPPKEKYLGVRERIYWKDLYKKHGEDFAAMQRDMKLNYKQYSKGQCQKKINLLLEKYQHLLQE